MRILLTTDTVGGVWTFTQRLAAELVRTHPVAMVSFGRLPSADQNAWVRAMRTRWAGSFTFEASAAPLEWMPDNAQAYSQGSEVLGRVATQFQPDVLHLNQFCFGALPREGALNLPRVVTAHSDVLSWARACRPGGLEDSGWLRQYTALAQAGLAGADCVTAPTAWMLAALREGFEVSRPAEVIPNGVKVPPAALEPSARKLQAVTAGRLWDEGKGLAILRDLMPAMPVLVAGEESFDEAAASMPPGVTALGALGWDALMQVFRESSVYLCTSVYEPFGLAAVEAAQCGCAVLARDLPSLREVWGDAAVYFHDADALQQQLARFAADPAWLAAAQARAGRRAAQFGVEQMATGYERLYQRLVPAAPLVEVAYAG